MITNFRKTIVAPFGPNNGTREMFYKLNPTSVDVSIAIKTLDAKAFAFGLGWASCRTCKVRVEWTDDRSRGLELYRLAFHSCNRRLS